MMTHKSVSILGTLCLLILGSSLVSSRVIDRHHPKGGLSSKVIYQSPAPLKNVFINDQIVHSQSVALNYKPSIVKKPMRKMSSQSKIYYIPIKPMPYRYIPGMGYDYQPLKINPIVMQSTANAFSNALNLRKSSNKKPSLIDSKTFRLKGHYYFNGKPNKISTLTDNSKLRRKINKTRRDYRITK